MAGSKFDPSIFAASLLADLEGHFQTFEHEAKAEVGEARIRSQLLQQDVAKTLLALETADTDAKREELRSSLEMVLPARVSSILSALESALSTDAQATAEAALTIILKVALATAKAFVALP